MVKNVSIALCTYNGGANLKAQLDSILSQTYPVTEIVIVDDCSTDNTQEILQAYAAKQKNMHVHINESNLGFNKNFEKAISLCGGEYIAICDQDDIWLPVKIRQLVEHIDENWLIFSNSEYMMPDGRVTGKRLIENGIQLSDYRNLLLKNFVTGHTSLLSRGILPYIFPLPDDGVYDWWIGFIALYHGKLKFHDKVLTYYRVHEDSVMQQKIKGKNYQGYLNDVRTQLGTFCTYTGIDEVDRVVIQRLLTKLGKHRYADVSTFLFLLRNFNVFFPDRSRAGTFSKINFVRKFVRA